MKFSTTWLVMALICAFFLVFNTSENPTQIERNVPITQNNHEQIPDAPPPANPVLKKDHNTILQKMIVPQSVAAHDRAKFLESLPFFVPMITATKSDAFTSDVDMDGFADPGDEIEYTVTISNAMGAMDATGLTFTDMVDANTTFVGGSVQASPVAIDDNSYTATGNIQITIPAPGVLANDFLGTPTATAMAIANGPTTQGGTVTLNADGSFTYNPPAGYEGDDTFTYTITNSLGNSTATVKITVSGMIWFINTSAAAGDGRLFTPFNSIAAFQALNDGMGNHPAAGDNIFIYSGNYTGPITLLNNQKLVGQGASATLSSITGITPPSGSLALPATGGANPVITTTVAATNAITLGMNNLIRGLTVGNTTGHKIIGNNFGTVTIGNTTTPDIDLNGTGPALSLTTGTLAGRIDELTSTSGGDNVLLNTVSGTLNPMDVINSSITSTTNGAAFSVTGSNPSITYPGTITKNSGTGKVVNIDGTTGNTITFNGTVTGGNASTGVTINNANGNVTFTTLTLGSGGARFTTTPLTINGGNNTSIYNLGVLSAFSNNTTTFSSTNADGTINCSSTSTLDATNGPAISIDGPAGLTTLGLTFASINCATSTTRGISIQDTDGSFTCNGGTISNIAQRGASFVNATNISLKDMPFTNANTSDAGGAGTCDYANTGSCNAAIYLSSVNTVTLDNVDITGTTVEQGINGISVTNLVVKNSNITNCGDAVEEGCIKIRNLTGTGNQIQNNTISRAADRMVDIFNNNTNLTLTVSGNTFDDTQFSVVGSNAIEIVGEGSSQLILDVLNNTFTKNRTFAAEVTARNTATLDFDFTNNTVNPMGGIGNGVQFALENTAMGKFNISNNPMIEVKGGTGVTISAKQNSMAEGRIKNNVIKVGGAGQFGYGVGVSLEFSPTVKVEVDANTITNVGFDAGIYAASSGVGTANLNLTASNNNITVVDASSQGAFYNQVGDGIGGDTHEACLNIKNNTVIVPAMGFYWTTVVFGGSKANMTTGTPMVGDNAETVWDDNGNMPNGASSVLGTTIQEIIVGTRDVVALACTLPTNPLPVTSDPVVMLTPTDSDTQISSPATETTAVAIASETQEQKESALSEPTATAKPQKGSNSSVEKMAPDVTVGPLTLPAGKNVTIKFRVTVNTPPLANCQISNQGLVTFDGGSVMTDDPAVGGATDPTVTPFNPLVADFSGTPLTGCIPLMVDFTDASTSGGTVTSWAWNFGDGNNSNAQNPSHTYMTPGMYTVSLTVMDNLGCTDTETKTNYVNAAEPEVNIAVAPMSVLENSGTPLVFTVTRTGSTDCELTIPFTITGTALEGTDYPDVIPTSFTIPANMTTAMLSITPTGDNIVESDETIIVTISDGANYSVGVNNSATGTITNDDMAVISIAATTQAAEDVTDGLFTISTDKQFDAPVTINFMVTGTASSGTDYTSIGTSVMLPANMSSVTIPIDVIGDAIVELNETVIVTLTSTNNASGSIAASPDNEATVTINDNDGTATVSIDDVMMLEGNTPNTVNFVFTVSLNKVVDANVTLDFMTMDNTATLANSDYQSNTGMITFPANGTLPQTQTITVVVNGDNAPEPDEQFFVDLKNLAASGRNVVFESGMATERGTGTIQDDDLSLSIGDMMITEGNSGTQILTFTVMLTAPAEPGGVTFDITTADNSATIADNDYELNSLTGQTIPEGMTSYTFDVTINGDMMVELDETFFVNVTNVVGAGVTDAQAIGTIKNDDTEVNVAVSPSSRDENSGLSLTYTFTRVGVMTNDLVVSFDLSGSATLVTDYALSGATLVSGSSYTVTIPMNMASADVIVTPVGDMTVELDETVVMTLTSPAAYNIGANNVASGTITNDDAATVSVVGASVNEDAGPLNFMVTLSNPVDVDVTVQFSTSDGVATDADNDYEPITNQTVTFLAGTTMAQSVPVTINDDNKVETDETFNGNIATLSAGTPMRNVSIMTNSAIGTILNNMDMATVSLKTSDANKPETNSGEVDFTFTIKLDNPVQGGFTLGYHTDDGSATTADNDYDDNDGTIDFLGNAGEEHTITVKVNGDTKVEADETFSVTIETFTNTTLQAYLKTASTYPATIQNDDAATLSINNVSLAEGISGTTTFTFTITLDNPVQGGFDIDYATAVGGATPASAGTDYTAVAATTLNFAGTMGESMMVSVDVAGDCDVEMDETFLLALSNLVLNDMNIDPADINITDQGIGTIQNDDVNYPDNRIYVDANAAGLNNGVDWTNAFNDLQDALRVACTCGVGQIWVADGTYYPDQGIVQTNNDRNSAFQLCDGIKVYGGFAGGEVNLSDRNIFTNIAILSGDLTQNDGGNFTNNSENAYHVVVASGTSSATLIDGFTVAKGNADGGGANDVGGGFLITFGSDLTIQNCIIEENFGDGDGGGIRSEGAATIINTVLRNNHSQGGGAIFHIGNGANSALVLINCVVSGNFSDVDAGGILAFDKLSVYNSTFSGNFGTGGFGAIRADRNLVMVNSIVWNNQDATGLGTANASLSAGIGSNITYSLIQGQNPAGMGNKDGITNAANANYPLFVTPVNPASAPTTSGDLRLQITSPAIDMGDDAAVPADSKDVDDDTDIVEPTPDRDLNNRIVGTMVDLGAFEFPCASEAGEIATADFTICQGDDPGTIFTASGAQNDVEYSFAFILASGNDILAYNINGDFDLSALTPGTYTVYGLSYATFNTPASVTNYLATVTTIAEIIADDADNGGELCLDLTDANEGQTASITVNEPATATLIDAYPAICRTKTLLLSELQGVIGGSATSATWSVLEADSNGQFLDTDPDPDQVNNVFGTADIFKPGLNDAKRGYVTLVLKTNDPDGDGPCPAVMDMIRIVVKNVDCGTFPWNGNE